MIVRAFVLFIILGITGETLAQSSGNDSCNCSNRSATLGVASVERTSILSDPSCPLRIVVKSPVRGEEISIPSGSVERNFMGLTVAAPFNKVSDHLVLSVALQSDGMYPPFAAKGAKESVAALKMLEDDPRAGLRWSVIVRASLQSPSDDKISLRATWRSLSAGSGFSVTEVRLSPANVAVWCR